MTGAMLLRIGLTDRPVYFRITAWRVPAMTRFPQETVAINEICPPVRLGWT